MKKLGIAFGLIALLGMTAPTAQALMVVNTTKGVTLFQHDFENCIVGEDPTTAAPSVGTWQWGTGKSAVGATCSDVDPYEGSQHLELVDGLGYLAAVCDGPSDPGDVIEIKYAFRSQGIWFHFLSAGGTEPSAVNIMDMCPVGSTSGWGGYWDDPGAFHPGAITQRHDPNAWNTMEIQYINGVTGTSVSVNGGPAEMVPITGAPGNLTRVVFGDEGPWAGPSYLDAIPDPATLSLLALGGLGILLRRTRR